MGYFNTHKPERKTERIVFLMTQEETLQLGIDAESSRMSVSDYCRLAIKTYQDTHKPAENRKDTASRGGI